MSRQSQERESARELETLARRLHRERGAPMIVRTEEDALDGSVVLCVLDRPSLRLAADGRVDILRANYASLPLVGRMSPPVFVDEGYAYIRGLVQAAAIELERGTFREPALGRSYDSVIEPKVVSKLAATLWSYRLQSDVKAVFYSVLWKHLDRDSARLTMRLQVGYGATLERYTQVHAQRPVLMQLAKETPNLLPLLARYQTGSPAFSEPLAVSLSSFGDIRQDLLEGGSDGTPSLTPAAWRLLTRLGAGAVFHWGNIGDRAVGFLNLAARSGVGNLSASMLKWFKHTRLAGLLEVPEAKIDECGYQLSGSYGHIEHSLSFDDQDRLVRVILQEAERARKQHRLQRFIEEDLRLVEDALQDCAATLNLPRQLSWKWLMRFQATWHEEQLTKRLVREGARWDSLLATMTAQGHVVTPLTDARMLFQEGQEMRHCVSSYTSSCEGGQTRIFSIRAGTVRATLELALRDVDSLGSRRWLVGQVKGFANRRVSPDVMKVAQLVCRRYNAEQRKVTPVADDRTDHFPERLAA